MKVKELVELLLKQGQEQDVFVAREVTYEEWDSLCSFRTVTRQCDMSANDVIHTKDGIMIDGGWMKFNGYFFDKNFPGKEIKEI